MKSGQFLFVIFIGMEKTIPDPIGYTHHNE